MRTLLCSFLVLVSLTGFSQVSLNGFGGPLFQVSSFDGDAAMFIGGGGALLVDGKFYAGAYGLAMVNSVERVLVDSSQSPPQDLDLQVGFNQGGLWTGYIVNPDNKVQVTINAMVGVGKVKTKSFDFQDRVFIVKPHIGIQYAATDFMRIELNGGYRLMNKVNDTGLFTDNNLSALFGGLHFRFGGFN